MKLIKLFLTLAFLPVFSNAQIIKLNLPKGAQYDVTTSTKITSIATVMGQDMESATDINTTETVKVKDTRPVETDLVKTMSKIVANIQSMGQEMVYNSDKKDNEGAMAETFDKMKGKEKNITVDMNGKITKQDNNTEESSSAAMMGIPNEDLTFLSNKFIGREVKTGTTWYDSTSSSSGNKMSTTTFGNYTIQAVNNGIATIAFAGKTNLTGTMEQMGQEMALSSTSKVTSQYEVDIATGLIKKSIQTSDGTMNIEAGGMSIPATTKSTITMVATQL